jgi:hypothetical protein
MSPFLRCLSFLLLMGLLACSSPEMPQVPEEVVAEVTDQPQPRYSLGQWSFNREHFAGKMNTFEFVAAAGEMGFDGVDYVSQFFSDKAEDYGFLDSLKAAATAAGVESVVILVHCNLSFIA